MEEKPDRIRFKALALVLFQATVILVSIFLRTFYSKFNLITAYYLAVLDEIVQVPSQDAINTAKELALKEVIIYNCCYLE